MKSNNYAFWPWLLLLIATPITTLNFSDIHIAIIIAACIVTIVSGYILWQGIEIMPNNPPFFGVVTRWGERLWKKKKNPDGTLAKDADGNQLFVVVYVEEGYNWLFLRNFMYGVIPINLSKRALSFTQVLTTPDGVTTNVPVGLAYTPCKHHIVNLLNFCTDDPFSVLDSMFTVLVADNFGFGQETLIPT